MIELVDFNEIYGKTAATPADTAKKTRRGRAKKVETAEAKVEEATIIEEKTAE